MSSLLYSWDPGETTGLAVLKVDGHTGEAFFTEALELRHVSEMARMYREWQDAPPHLKPAAFVAEKFYLFPGSARKLIYSSFPASVTLGQIELLAYMSGVRLFIQKAADMHHITDSDLLERKFWRDGALPKSEHMKDAMKHAIYFYYNTWKAQQTPHKK